MTGSPLLQLPGAVAAEGIDAGVAAHYGSFNQEQRALVAGTGFVDLSHRPVLRISGPDRLTWLHSLTTQFFLDLPAGVYTEAFILSPHGHLEQWFAGVDDGESFLAHTEPGFGQGLINWLDQMRFMSRVEVTEVTDVAVIWRPGGYEFVSREALTRLDDTRCGLWAHEALRIARGEVRLGQDTDHRTIPNELGVLGPFGAGNGVHLDKGCYRGQETVARVHNLGRPPRRLTWLHIDGSENELPAVGADIVSSGKVIGRMGTSGRHFEDGPIGLGLIKRSVPLDAPLSVAGLALAQEQLVDPEVGLHVRARL